MNGTVSTESGPWARGSRCTRAATASTASRTKSRAPKRRRTPSAWPTSPTSTTTTTSSSRAIANVSRLFLFVFNHLGFTVFFTGFRTNFCRFFLGAAFTSFHRLVFFPAPRFFLGGRGGGSFSNRISVRLCCFLWLWPAFNGSWLRFSPVPDSASILSLFSLCYRKRTRIKLGPRKKNHSVQVERHGKATFNLFEPCFQFRKPSKTR